MRAQSTMAELIDPRPVFTLVMGCNGCGKSAWKRDNYDRLPQRYFDQDSIAGGIGDWNAEDARQRTRHYVGRQIEDSFAARRDFGIEITFSGRPGPDLLHAAIAAGYRVEGYYLGTASWDINARRIEYRVLSNTGHHVDARRLPEWYRYSLANLRRHFRRFDLLEMADNTVEAEDRIPDPILQLRAEKGAIRMRLADPQMAPWCAEFLQRLAADERKAQRREKLRAERGTRRRGMHRADAEGAE